MIVGYQNFQSKVIWYGFGRLTLNEVCDLLDDDDLTPSITSIAVFPPSEQPEANTDADSDYSDEEVTCALIHLPRRLLLSEAEIGTVEQDSSQDDAAALTPENSRSQSPLYDDALLLPLRYFQ